MARENPVFSNLELPETSMGDLVTRAIYEIATGAWRPGEKLPSVRQAEARWGLDRRTVMKAYQRLVELGLVEVADRSGYYIARDAELGRVSRHRHEMENLYERMAQQVVSETDLNVLGVFRYFVQYAEQKARLWPEVAFAECTASQAEGHAAELMTRLGVPCLAMTTTAIDGKRARIPTHVHTLLVTGFHYGDLKDLGDDDLDVVSVPIEVSPGLAARLGERPGDVVIVEHDRTEAEHLQRDVRQLDPTLNTRLLVVDDVNVALAELHDRDPRAADDTVLAALSPRIWGEADESWWAHPDVVQIEFGVTDDAWARVADAIGLPLGEVSRG